MIEFMIEFMIELNPKEKKDDTSRKLVTTDKTIEGLNRKNRLQTG